MVASRRFDLSAKRLEMLESLLRAEGVDRAATQVVTPRQDREAPVPLTSAQKRLWFLEQLMPGSQAYVIPTVLRVEGEIDFAAFANACQEVVCRHESLRTVFFSVDGRPQQQVKDDLQAEVEVVDLQAMAPAEREREVARRIDQLFRKPFDLTTGSLLRFTALRLTVDETVLLLTMHHIVSDQWSMGVLLRELVALYAASTYGVSSDLPELKVQYPDYAVWQQETLDQEALADDLAYWRQQLAKVTAEINLPTDRARPKERSSRGGSVAVELTEPLVSQLRTLARSEGVTLFMLLLAAFKVLLYRLSGQDDLVVGTPVANRTRSEIEPLIGFFVNTLVLRSDLSGNPSVRELLQRVSSSCLGAFEHQELPFEQLVDELQPARSLGRTPLFQVAFSFQNVPFPGWSVGSIRIEPLPLPTISAKFDLELMLFEENDRIWGRLEYASDLYDETTVQRLVAYLHRIINGMVQDPAQAIGALPMLSEEERHRVIVEGNATNREWPGTGWIFQRFEQQVLRTPDAEALCCGETRLSYQELNRRANQLAFHLRRLGVGRDVMVGVCMERSIEMVVGLLAILKAGGAYLPLDPGYPEARLVYMLEDAQVPVLLTQERLRDRLPAKAATTLVLDQLADALADEPEHNPEVEVRGDDLAYVIYTSGSTGKPKGVMNMHAAISNRLLWMQDAFKIDTSDRVLQKTPFSFDVSVWELFWPLMTGACLVMARPEGHKDAEYLVQLIRDEQITTLHFVPSMLQVFLQASAVEQCRSLRRVICSGEALPRELQERFYSRLAAELHNLYGPTEAAVDVTFWHCRRDGDPRPVPIGYPIANTQIYLLDRNRQPVPIGVPGELYIGGANLARGYLNRPELTAERFLELVIDQVGMTRLYRTGDLARYRNDGAIEYLGRLDFQVKLRGFRIELGEIEQVLASHDKVREVIVTASDQRAGDTMLVAYLTGDEEPSTAELQAFLKDRLPEYMVPAVFVFLPTFPLTPNGKVDRKALPAPDLVRPELETAFVAPRSELERTLAEVWSNLLGIEQVGVNDSFFALGGHSLLATQLVTRLTAALGVELPLRELFDRPTISELAAWIEAGGAAGARDSSPIPSVSRDHDLPLSFAQEWLCVLYPIAPEDPFHNVVTGVRSRGPLDMGALEQSLQALVDRHEALRTRLVVRPTGMVQVVDQHGSWPVTTFDLRQDDAETRQAEMLRHIQEESKLPFSLADGPLVRARHLRLADEESVLVLTLHHAVTDNWSYAVLVRELGHCYEAYANGHQPALPPLVVQYPDYAVWQRQQLEAGALDQHLDYWRQHLADLPQRLHLTAEGLDSEEAVDGTVRSFVLDSELTGALEQLARQEGVTLFMVLLAAYKLLLMLYSGSTDILVGSPNANRLRQETEELIGYFVNTLVLRTDLAGDPSFGELIRRVRDVILGANAHMAVPLQVIRSDLEAGGEGPVAGSDTEPMFQHTFNLLNAPLPPLELRGLQLEMVEIDSGYVFPHVLPGLEPASVDLGLIMRPDGEQLRGMWLYDLNRVEPRTIGRIIRTWRSLLELLLAEPGAAISEIGRRLQVKLQATTSAAPDRERTGLAGRETRVS